MKIEFYNVKHFSKYYKTFSKNLYNLMKSGNYILGNNVKEFEEQWAKYCNSKHCVAVNSGTSALYLSCLLANVYLKKKFKNDKFTALTVANTFIATIEAPILAGMKVKFCDVGNDFLIDVKKAEEIIKNNKDIKVIIAVDLYGQLCDYVALKHLCKKYDLLLIRDACQAHGKFLNDDLSIPDLTCFSFYPTKNLGGIADSGAIVSNESIVNWYLKILRNHGRVEFEKPGIIGTNSRMNEIDAIFLKERLKCLDKENELRNFYAYLYNDNLSKFVDTPAKHSSRGHAYHIYTILTKDNKERNELQEYLLHNDISVKIVYEQILTDIVKTKCDISNTIDLNSKMLSLPLNANITNKQIEYIINKIWKFYGIN